MVTALDLERPPWAENDEPTPPLSSSASILGSFVPSDPRNAWSIVGKGHIF